MKCTVETYRRDLSLLERGVDTKDLQLAVDIGLLLLLDNGVVDVESHNGRQLVLLGIML